MFRFKQFSVDQNGCAMKINTDGVLLGALATVTAAPKDILDIGTGTGVIALMLAQRFCAALIDAVEIDKMAAKTAAANFNNSPFSERLNVYPVSFMGFFEQYPEKKYDLIVSNPPFHINSLESPKAKKTLAKHADEGFFEDLIKGVAGRLTADGLCWLVLPLQAAALVELLAERHQLYLQKIISVHSFNYDVPHREIIALGRVDRGLVKEQFVIYAGFKAYSTMYRDALQDFFTIF